MSMYYRGRDYETHSEARGLSVERSLLLSLWQLAYPVRFLLVAAFLLMIADAAADLARPYLMKVAISFLVLE